MANETYFPTSEQFDLMNTHLDRIANSIAGTGIYTGYDGMQRAVRSGLGPSMFPVGAQFTVEHDVYGTRVSLLRPSIMPMKPSLLAPISSPSTLPTASGMRAPISSPSPTPCPRVASCASTATLTLP